MVYGKKIVVTMTSWVQRIHNCLDIIKAILDNTVKPDLVFLNLSANEFKRREVDLPENLVDFIHKHSTVKINWVTGQNVWTMKKVFPILPYLDDDDLIIIIDDDLVIQKDIIETRINEFNSLNGSCAISACGDSFQYSGLDICGIGKYDSICPTSIVTKKMLAGYEEFLQSNQIVETYNDFCIYSLLVLLNGYKIYRSTYLEYETNPSLDIFSVSKRHLRKSDSRTIELVEKQFDSGKHESNFRNTIKQNLKKNPLIKPSIHCNFMDFIYVADSNMFIVDSIIYSIHTIMYSGNIIRNVYVLHDFNSNQYSEKLLSFGERFGINIVLISVKSIVNKLSLNELYDVQYKNKCNIVYKPIVNAKMLVPLIADKLKCDKLVFFDSDMEILTNLGYLMSMCSSSTIGLYGINERGNLIRHINQDIITDKVAKYNLPAYDKKTGSWDYLNTGILVFNLPFYRKIPLEERLKFIKECFELKNKCKFDFPEQDCMNYMWTKKCLNLDDYGVFSYKKDETKNAKIIHYIWAGNGKQELKEKIKIFMDSCK